MTQRSGYESASAGGAEASTPPRPLPLRPQPSLGTQRRTHHGATRLAEGRDLRWRRLCRGASPAPRRRQRMRYSAAQALPC